MTQKNIAIGKTYENRFGYKVKIIEQLKPCKFIGDDDIIYGIRGVPLEKGSNWILAVEVD